MVKYRNAEGPATVARNWRQRRGRGTPERARESARAVGRSVRVSIPHAKNRAARKAGGRLPSFVTYTLPTPRRQRADTRNGLQEVEAR